MATSLAAGKGAIPEARTAPRPRVRQVHAQPTERPLSGRAPAEPGRELRFLNSFRKSPDSSAAAEALPPPTAHNLTLPASAANVRRPTRAPKVRQPSEEAPRGHRGFSGGCTVSDCEDGDTAQDGAACAIARVTFDFRPSSGEGE